MFNFTTVVFDGTSPAFYFTNTSGWKTSSSNNCRTLVVQQYTAKIKTQWAYGPHSRVMLC